MAHSPDERRPTAATIDGQRNPERLNPFSLDPGDELPLGVQLSWRLRALIASGHLVAGDRLPSVRALAEWSGVNVNTVRAVYRRLEDEDLVTTQHGSGTFVAPGTRASPDLDRIANEAIAEAREAGLSPRDLAVVALASATVAEGLEEALSGNDEAPPPEPPSELEASAIEELPEDEQGMRRELRRQIAYLEAQLASHFVELEHHEPGRVRSPEPRVAGAEELRRTRDLLVERLAEARAAAERRGRRESRARERLEGMRRDPEAHRWEVITNADLGEPGCTTYEVAPQYGPLGALMRWWRVKVSSGCPLDP